MSVPTDERSTFEQTAAAESREDALRAQALTNLKRKRRFAQDALGFATVNGVLWVIWALSDRTTDGSMPWPAWVTAIWGFFLLMDAWKAYGPWPRSLHHPLSESEIEREEERIRRA